MRYKVVYDKKNCTSKQQCLTLEPGLWGKDSEGKAILKKGKLNPKTGKYELWIGEKQLKRYKDTALICPAYVIDILSGKTNRSILRLKPTAEDQKQNVPVHPSSYDSRKEWRMDRKGFFTIKPYPEENLIRVRYYGSNHSLRCVIVGRSAEEIYQTILRKKFVGMMNHAAYLGAELVKAEIAMQKNLAYEQDSPLP